MKPPKNPGRPWDQDEMHQLVREWQSNMGLYEMAVFHNRTPNAIITRLVVLGRLTLIGRTYHKVDPMPYLTIERVKTTQDRWVEDHKGVER